MTGAHHKAEAHVGNPVPLAYAMTGLNSVAVQRDVAQYRTCVNGHKEMTGPARLLGCCAVGRQVLAGWPQRATAKIIRQTPTEAQFSAAV